MNNLENTQIVIKNVSKFYGEVLGVNGVSLSLDPGITSLEAHQAELHSAESSPAWITRRDEWAQGAQPQAPLALFGPLLGRDHTAERLPITLDRHLTSSLNEALEEYIRRRKQKGILDLFGTIEYDEDYDYKEQRKRDS